MLEKYIYKGLKPFTLGLIPSRSRTITDGAGNISVGAPILRLPEPSVMGLRLEGINPRVNGVKPL